MLDQLAVLHTERIEGERLEPPAFGDRIGPPGPVNHGGDIALGRHDFELIVRAWGRGSGRATTAGAAATLATLATGRERRAAEVVLELLVVGDLGVLSG